MAKHPESTLGCAYGSEVESGDWESVFIQGDKWLPYQHSSRAISPLKNFPSNTRVCVLLDEETVSWIEDRVLEEFLPHEAKFKLSLPLSSTRAEDTLIWTGTKNGCYSTKSAFHLLSYKAAGLVPGPSNPSAHKKFLLDIWSLNVPNKIHHFIWRSINDTLPTKLNLHKRHITQNFLCERCCCETEDVIHAI